MKIKMIVILGILSGFIAKQCFGQRSDIDSIKKLNQDWLNSIAKKDSATLSNNLADDFIMIDPSGSKLTKKDNLSFVLSSQIEYYSIDIDSINVTLLSNDIGILSCWLTFGFKADGKDMTGKNCY